MDYNKLLNEFEHDTAGRWKNSTQLARIRRLEQSIIPYFRELNIEPQKITSHDIFEWQQFMFNEKGYKISYINTLRSTLSVFFEFLIEKKVLFNNAITEAVRIKNYEPEEPFEYWEFDEFSQFIKYVDDIRYKIFFSFLYYTGCRVGEVRATSWKQINFKTCKILVNKTVSPKPNKHGNWDYTLPKNNRARTLKMNNAIYEMLLDWKDVCKRQKGFSETDLIFHRPNKLIPLSTTTIERKKNKYCSLSSVKQIRIHDFRHSNASLLINMGANVTVVSERLGHKDKTVTLNRYSHFFPTMEDQIVNKMNELTGVYLDNHTEFAKALMEFMRIVKDLPELNNKEKEVMKTLDKLVWG